MMITYTVKVNDSGTVRWYNEDGLLHRLDGPAVCGSHGGKQWYIGGVKYTEEKFLAKIEIMNRHCKGKKVIVDGVEYTLI